MPNVFEVIGTALGLGIVHVLTGPDHLSALSTLSVGKPLKLAFGLGVRWGCGHSFGLLIVAIIFFAVGHQINLDTITYYADLFVGVFMIVLGGWYAFKAYKQRKKYLQQKEDVEIKNLLTGQHVNNINMELIDLDDNKDILNGKMKIKNKNNDEIDSEQIELEEINDDPEINDIDEFPKSNKNELDNSSDSTNTSESDQNEHSKSSEHLQLYQAESSLSKKKNNHKNDNKNSKSDCIPDDDIIIDGNSNGVNELFDRQETKKSKCLTRLAAFIAGVFHGIAGPGGVLGVMVALRLNDWFLSSLYLLLFFISSIITMGCYAIIYGYTTSRITFCANNKQKCAYILKLISSIFSLVIGVLWLCLTFAGTMDDWFD